MPNGHATNAGIPRIMPAAPTVYVSKRHRVVFPQHPCVICGERVRTYKVLFSKGGWCYHRYACIGHGALALKLGSWLGSDVLVKA